MLVLREREQEGEREGGVRGGERAREGMGGRPDGGSDFMDLLYPEGSLRYWTG